MLAIICELKPFNLLNLNMPEENKLIEVFTMYLYVSRANIDSDFMEGFEIIKRCT